MSPAVERLLDEFEHLSSTEKYQAVREVLRRSTEIVTDPISDEALNALADERFQALDAEELDEESAAR